ncbi:MAG: response regulator [Candidatus Sumerlaeia bacterium]|nr:response regulator [Candidatus Sumerlaeia bacterium]
MQKFRLMVVDDDPDVRFVVCALLGSDFETTEALNGLDALEKVERHQPDLVLLDINMPVMNGLSCCSAIKRNLGAEDLPVIFMSAAANDSVRKHAVSVGGVAFLEKPFNTTTLIHEVREALKRTGTSPVSKRFNLAELERIDSASEIEEPQEPVRHDQAPATESSVETVAQEGPVKRKRRVFGKQPMPAHPPEPKVEPSVAKPPPPAPREGKPPAPPPAKPKAPPPIREKKQPQPAQPTAAEILAKRRLSGVSRKAPETTEKPRVLVLIDSPQQLETCNAALKGLAEFLPLEDPVEAVELIARFQPDIIVASVQSVAYSGLQIAGLLRSNPRLASTEVVFLHPPGLDIELVKKAMALTTNPILRLPHGTEEFRSAIEGVAGKAGFKVRPKNLSYGVYVKEVIRAADEERLRENKDRERQSVEMKMHSLARFMAKELSPEHSNYVLTDAPQDNPVRDYRVK